jgi:hypothetical protein
MEEVHKSRASRSSEFNAILSGGTLQKSAYIDPSDPSVIYVSQPTIAEPRVDKKSDDIPMAIPVAYPVPGYATPAPAPNYSSAFL